jgi:hypothetical protein
MCDFGRNLRLMPHAPLQRQAAISVRESADAPALKP